MNKGKLRGIRNRHICDNEIHNFDRKISRRNRIDIVTTTTLGLSDHSLRIPRRNHGNNQPLR